ncbi:hypothetical protein [Priestia aryabhattai]|nr:hypothetical protein [Priestia aryabhattai]
MTDSVSGHVVYSGLAVYCGIKFTVRGIKE